MLHKLSLDLILLASVGIGAYKQHGHILLASVRTGAYKQHGLSLLASVGIGAYKQVFNW